jgi:hypothetical protein
MPRRVHRPTLPAQALLSLALVLLPSPAAAQWTFEFFMGTAFNAPTPLTISQTGYPDIRITADYETKPLHPIQYYAYRLARWRDNDGWLLEHLHHKVYLKNVTAEVPAFEVSHGYNLVTINRGWRRGANLFIFGGGAVISYTHSEVRGLHYSQDSPYHLSGVTIQGSAARRVNLTGHFFISGEAKLTASWARVPVVDGHAKVPNAALHLLAGAGLEF